MGVSKARRALVKFASGGPPPDVATDDATRDLLREAVKQGMLGLLARALRERETEAGSSPPVLPELEPASGYTLLALGLRRLELAGRVLRSLMARGVRALPLKGAAVAEWLYSSPAERPMADVDLLVLDDWPRAADLLRADGFREVARADHAVAFVGPGSDVPLELHHSPTSCPGLFPIDPEGLWARRLPGPGFVPWRPSDEDLVLTSALHAGFQHGLVLSLVQWLDLRRLLTRPLDTGLLLRLSRAARAEACLAAALETARVVVDAPLAPALRQALAPALPGCLRSALAGGEALDFVSPAQARLLSVRWALLRGRRLELLRRTVASRTPGETLSAADASLAALRRTVSLARRWALPAGLAALGRAADLSADGRRG